MKDYKKTLFEILIKNSYCIRTNNYVSTRRGELRDEEYVISTEIQKFVRQVTLNIQLPSYYKDLAKIYKIIKDTIEYEDGIVEITIKDAIFTTGSRVDAMKNIFDSLLNRLTDENIIEEIRKIPSFATEIVASKNILLQFINKDVQNYIIKPLLSDTIFPVSEEIKEIKPDFIGMVRTLIDKKYSLYQVAAQFGGKEIYMSMPYIERCVIDLTTPLPGDEGLRTFISILHQVLVESSTKDILKFREGNFTSLEEWLEIEITSDTSVFYEDAKSFFRDLNRLRNFYSHIVDAKGIFEAGLIFSKLIGKYYPEKEDIEKTQIILLERSIRALEGLERALRRAWHYKTSRK